VKKKEKKLLEFAYCRARDKPSDINMHVPRLRQFAEQCEHVTEFGVRHGVSTTALLAGAVSGKLQRLVSYDHKLWGRENDLRDLAPDVFKFVKKSTLEINIAPTDMLFIDSRHTYSQLSYELLRGYDKVRRWIALHDTRLFGHRDESMVKGPGLLLAVREFLAANMDWFVAEHYEYNNGFTVLSRNSKDRPSIIMEI